MERWIRARFLPGIPLGPDGRRITAGKEHIALSRKAAREGMVLPEALREYEQTLDLTRNAHYDLAPEGIRTTTLYLIRTDL